jgi:hypothetical protein
MSASGSFGGRDYSDFFYFDTYQLMPNKRKSRGKSSEFYCAYCQTRLWRTGHQKYYLVSQNIDDIRKDFNLTRKKASLLAAQQPHPVNLNIWIEDFFCPGHQEKIWLRISKTPINLWPLLKRAKLIGKGHLGQ